MCGDFFVKRLENRYGLDVLIAEGVHQDNVHHALYAELARGVFNEATRARFRAAIADLVGRSAQVIVLGCTEFGLLVKADDSPVPLVDTTVMHVEAAVNAALADAE
jgi:aspartate racemase